MAPIVLVFVIAAGIVLAVLILANLHLILFVVAVLLLLWLAVVLLRPQGATRNATGVMRIPNEVCRAMVSDIRLMHHPAHLDAVIYAGGQS